MILRIATVLTATFLLILACGESGPEETATGYFEYAQEKMREFEFETADSVFSELTGKFPESPLGLTGNAFIDESQMLYYDAMGKYLLILDNSPRHIPAARGLARIYQRFDRPEDAAALLASKLPSPTATPDDFAVLADAYIAMRNASRAALIVDSAVAMGLDDDYGAILSARVAVLRGQIDSATAIINEVDIDGLTDPEHLTALADYYDERGYIDSAVAVGARAVSRESADLIHVQDHFLRMVKHNYFFQARQEMDRIAGLDDSNDVVPAMQTYYAWHSGDSFMGDQAAVAYMQAHPQRVTPRIYEIRTKMISRNLAAAIEEQGIASALIGELEYPDAIESRLQAEVNLVRAEATGQRMNPITLTLPPGIDEEHRHLKMMFFVSMSDAGDPAAPDTLESMVRRHNESPLWMHTLANIAAHPLVRKYERSGELFARTLQLDPYDIAALRDWLAMLEQQVGVDSAYSVLRKHANAVARFPQLQVLEAILQTRVNGGTEAVPQFVDQVTYVKGNMTWFRRMTEALFRSGETGAAESVMMSATELNPENADAYLLGARMAADIGDYQTALELARTGVQFEQDNADLQVQQARALVALGQVDEGLALFKEVRLNTGRHVEASIYYSRALADLGQDTRQAGNLARSAVGHSGGAPEAVLALSYYHFKIGELDRALRQARRAASVYNDNPHVIYWLGKMQYESGDAETARQHLNRAIELGLYGQEREEANRILSQLRG